MLIAAAQLLAMNEYISRAMPSQQSFSQNQKTVCWGGNGDALHELDDADDFDSDSDSNSGCGADEEGLGFMLRRRIGGVATRHHASARYVVIIALV
jgi:hypothetical protein